MKDSLEFITSFPKLISISSLEKAINRPRSLLRATVTDKEKYYKEFVKKYASGKQRLIDNPTGTLKVIQKLIQKNVLSKVTFHETIFGGIKGRSNIDNAKYHLGSNIIIKLDLKSFFPSTKASKVYKAFRYNLGYGKDVSSLLTQICCRKDGEIGYVPQGATTSTLVSTLGFLPTYKQIKLITDSQNLRLTSFIDDITISGDNIDNISSTVDKIINVI